MSTETTLPCESINSMLYACSHPELKNSLAGVYITTNETEVEKSRQALSKKPINPIGCHIGFSGWHNFNIMATRRSQAGLIVDYNPNNKVFIELTILCLKNTSSRLEFLKMAKDACSKIQKNHPDFFSPNINPTRFQLSPEEEIEAESTLECSWLSSDTSFAHIQNLAHHERIVAITEDIRQTDSFSKIVKIYHSVGFSIDTVYVSNICDYMMSKEDRENYTHTLHSLLDHDTTLIDCPTRKTYQETIIRLEQRVSSLEELLSKDPKELFEYSSDSLESTQTTISTPRTDTSEEDGVENSSAAIDSPPQTSVIIEEIKEEEQDTPLTPYRGKIRVRSPEELTAKHYNVKRAKLDPDV